MAPYWFDYILISSFSVLNLQLKTNQPKIKTDLEETLEKEKKLKEFPRSIEDHIPKEVEKAGDHHCEFCQDSYFDEKTNKKHKYCDRNISHQNNFF